ncbi:MAG: enoyl-CoA hydratase/isomerase family protein [Pseudomonadota bacterium]
MNTYQSTEELDIEITPEGILIATMNRPSRMNAFNGALRENLRNLFSTVAKDEDIRVLVMAGAGGNFCSGADLTAEDRRGWPTLSHEPIFAWCIELLEMPKPTIAAVDGAAAGGGLGLALLCDLRICSDRARLIPIWNKRAIHPDDLVTWTLPRQVGYSRALHWLYMAEDIPLNEAKDSGLILDIVAPDDLQSTALSLAQKLSAGPPMHHALTKQSVLRGLSLDPRESAMMESWGQNKAFASEDFKEGVKAFKEKRAPKFTGK